ncbi:ParB/RepB/Spo0J family partition protein [Leptospira interrogans]|uniref:ParB/RepB/Spo0J family partition protein n=5 Tax=Leptospira interrogans TaxID=173 RepID=A0AAQ0B0Y9_LEPIR|nr:ParB/RepB/Spo0J family partition protein [Leptospira interrogans]ALE40342.1 Chromosome (plasmid) partitioning protein ParB [Leptospira interrogans serovar Hardjo str. Norma]EKO26548.1 ParB-like protein [Leptospira interrogans str. UI 12621]EKO71089.1 ParB-like protein [Leptospira interrogans serovar Canicola str. Fiocruz LV133]EKO95978.1 ParB-like protein [Leptospira interrogans str. Brem 329]EMK15639.1 ParB-like protein [Leptospira interrogans str. Kito]
MVSKSKKIFQVKDAFGNTTDKTVTNLHNNSQSNALLRELMSKDSKESDQVVQNIPVSKIISKENPRKNFNSESLQELAESIKKYGLIQPISVRKIGNEYHLIAGERRLRATKLNGEEFISSIVKNVHQVDPDLIPEYKLIENIHREDLADIEVALSLTVIKSKYKLSASQLAEKFNKSISWVKQKLMHASAINDLVEAGKIKNPDLISMVPTSILMEVLPAIKANHKDVLDWLLIKAKNDSLPTQAEARKYAKSISQSNDNSKKTKSSITLKTLQDQIKDIDRKIDELKKKKKKLKDQMDLLI